MQNEETRQSQEEVDETTEENADTPETNEETSEVEADDSKNTNEEEPESQDSIDYKAKLEEERQRREKAEEAVVKYKKQAKEKESDDSQPQEESDQPDVSELVRQEVSKARQEMVQDQIDAQLNSIENEDERELVKYHYHNTINPSGFSTSQIREDVTRARLIANKDKIMQENQELRESLKSKQTVSNTGVGSNRKHDNLPGEPLDQTNADFLKRRGLNPSEYRLVDGEIKKVK